VTLICQLTFCSVSEYEIDVNNDMLVEKVVEQTSSDQFSCYHAHAAAVAVMQVAKSSTSTDTSQDSDNNHSSSDGMSRKPMSITIDIDDAAAKERRQIEELDFRFLCIDLRTLPGYLQFLTCCGGVFFFYLIYGYCQVSICNFVCDFANFCTPVDYL